MTLRKSLGVGALVVAGLSAVSACAPQGAPQGDAPGRMPNLVGHSLNYSLGALERVNADHQNTIYRDSGTNDGDKWVVCNQRPDPGRDAISVVLVVDEDCDP